MSLPATSGISLKPVHYRQILDKLPATGWFEIHPENFMGNGGPPHHYLHAICEHYPLSMHGVGMSLGSAHGIDKQHLQALVELVKRYQPAQVSEHLAWSHYNNVFLNDLLPLPYHEESLAIVSDNIQRVQEALGRNILIENPSSYLDFNNSTLSEPEFLTELTRRTGCGLLLDVNNIYVSCTNLGLDPHYYIKGVPLAAVGEIHLAGHSVQQVDGMEIRIDDHGSVVKEDVWALHEHVLQRAARRLPVMIEWDTDVPTLPILLAEGTRANDIANCVLAPMRTEVF